ncbi:hypothetical protein BGZ80_000505 [Entomortierella chlamydospora]|uniref:Uncharacterized protein n=1 Tax=Entomortierella chlamydospora TaxID=101097 RepID=A0A9P6SYP0_9FUNG|nr:hypothetical protein BGZ79_006548 [Entomortierella chlamydospora]KAG0011690.1 hypothetical protein BGZ80_000505 [Entomortierella chlamydospora]
MVQARRFHSNFLFIIPLTQGVLLITILDFCKNAVFFGNQVQNLSPNTYSSIGNGQQLVRRKDSAYLAAQYLYTIWLIAMMVKAIIGFRANLKFNIRWMGIYNILFGIDTGFEFIHTTLGIIFQDTSQLDDADIINRYCVSFLILIIQIYGFICCWMHLRWVHAEMPHLITPTSPRETFFEMMVPTALRRSRGTHATGRAIATTTTTLDPEEPEPSMVEAGLAPVAVQRASTVPGAEQAPDSSLTSPSLSTFDSSRIHQTNVSPVTEASAGAGAAQTSSSARNEESEIQVVSQT